MVTIFMVNEDIARGMVCFFHQKKHSYLIYCNDCTLNKDVSHHNIGITGSNYVLVCNPFTFWQFSSSAVPQRRCLEPILRSRVTMPAVNFYNATDSLACFENKIFLLYLEKRSSLLQRWRYSCKFKSRRIGACSCFYCKTPQFIFRSSIL
jgi:hypothetical protein